MAFIDHIRTCNRHDLDAFRPFVVAGHHVGWVHAVMADRLAERPECFAVTADRVYLMDAEGSVAARSNAVAAAMERLAKAGIVPPPRGEDYPVMVGWGDEPLAGCRPCLCAPVRDRRHRRPCERLCPDR